MLDKERMLAVLTECALTSGFEHGIYKSTAVAAVFGCKDYADLVQTFRRASNVITSNPKAVQAAMIMLDLDRTGREATGEPDQRIQAVRLHARVFWKPRDTVMTGIELIVNYLLATELAHKQ